MPIKRKQFPQCGHKGFGTHCHRCAQADALLIKAKDANPKDAAKLVYEAKRLKARAGDVPVWTQGEKPPISAESSG